MIVGVPKESSPGERRVAVVPAVIPALVKAGCELLVESGAGLAAGHDDDAYAAKQARIVDRAALFAESDVILQVLGPGANPTGASSDLAAYRDGQFVIAHHDPLSEPALAQELAARGVIGLSMEMMPRITRAQSMDSLSSMATIAGYRAVLIAALQLPRLFPLLMTAAGTLKAAKVFIVGVGVAGLQAIATARRLGAVVSAYDVRPAVKEQVESLGAKFVEFDLETGDAEDKGGYAKEQSDEFLQRQQAAMARVIAEQDVVITTAAIPGRKAPILVTEAMVRGMARGSVIVDLAAERGGNCELTRPSEAVDVDGVTVLGPLNLPSEHATHASQMYAKNIVTFLLSLIKDGQLALAQDDEVVQGTLLCRDGEVVQPRIRDLLGLPPIASDPSQPAATDQKEGAD